MVYCRIRTTASNYRSDNFFWLLNTTRFKSSLLLVFQRHSSLDRLIIMGYTGEVRILLTSTLPELELVLCIVSWFVLSLDYSL